MEEKHELTMLAGEWTFCPECGSEEIHYEEGNHKQCAYCHQEWYSHINYSRVVKVNLQELFKKANQQQALEIALPVLEQKTHESVIAEQLEAVRDSLTLNPHQNALISCAIDRLNELNVRVVELSRSLFEQQPQPSTNPQIDNDGWIEWKGGSRPVESGVTVATMCRNGSCAPPEVAIYWDWGHSGGNLDIIAYRLIESDGREG